MKKFALQVILLISVTVAAVYFYSPGRGSNIPSLNQFLVPQKGTLREAIINGVTLKVEVADTNDKRSKGLGGRELLASDEGMLFIFPEVKKHQFWMKGLKFPLDFIWIRNNVVVDIIRNAQVPPQGAQDEDLPIYLPNVEIDKVLEVNSGIVDSLNIRIGDTITLVEDARP